MTTRTITESDVRAGPADRQWPPASWPAGLLGGGADRDTTMRIMESLTAVLHAARREFLADGAAIVMAADGGAISAVASDSQASIADALQIEHHQGPALQAIRGHQPVLSGELRLDGRWRSWAPRAADLGFRSVLALTLTGETPFGAVTLYSRRPAFFSGDSLVPGLELAQQASLSITAAALRSRPYLTVLAVTTRQARHHLGVRS